MAIHPTKALYEGYALPPLISACDHYAGNIILAAKAIALQTQLHGAFDITLDLEDGAVVGQETILRSAFLDLITGPANLSGRIGIRIHDFRSAFWRDDITTTVQQAGSRVSHITIPKTICAAELRVMIEHLRLELIRTETSRSIPVHVLIESPQALAEARRIASFPEVRCLELGLMDFVSAHGGIIPAYCMQSPGQFEHPLIRHAKIAIVAAAVAHNKVAAHNVTTAYNDAEQTRQDALRARTEFGFLRMWSIHPAQIRPIIAALAPEAQELSTATSVLLAAYEKDWAPVSLEGRLHDRASYRYYWTQLQ
ncbi:MAG: CoA ester lyase, partial [Proteobacteria bacterium]|nr:CoA ester lyase [Pseudomonadota bacterium]